MLYKQQHTACIEETLLLYILSRRIQSLNEDCIIKQRNSLFCTETGWLFSLHLIKINDMFLYTPNPMPTSQYDQLLKRRVVLLQPNSVAVLRFATISIPVYRKMYSEQEFNIVETLNSRRLRIYKKNKLENCKFTDMCVCHEYRCLPSHTHVLAILVSVRTLRLWFGLMAARFTKLINTSPHKTIITLNLLLFKPTYSNLLD